jgi:hypothetical protein
MSKQAPINPFIISDFSVPCRAVKQLYTFKGSMGFEDSPQGITEGSSELVTDNLIDAAKSTKVYSSEKIFQQFTQLSSPAKDLFMYITMKLPNNQDYLEFKDSTYAELVGKSVRSVRLWRAELKWLMQVRKGRSNMYWVNPAVIFNGNRATFYPSWYRNIVATKTY